MFLIFIRLKHGIQRKSSELMDVLLKLRKRTIQCNKKYPVRMLIKRSSVIGFAYFGALLSGRNAAV